MNPLDYSLCGHRVTIYRKTGDTVNRKVITNAYLSANISMPNEHYGKSKEKKFLLIIPGDQVSLQPGDRVYDGIGPKTVEWRNFVPAVVSGLYEISYVKPCFWEGQIAHWEAGNRKETL